MKASATGAVLVLLILGGDIFGQGAAPQNSRPAQPAATVLPTPGTLPGELAPGNSLAQTPSSACDDGCGTAAAGAAPSLRDDHPGPPDNIWFRGSYLMYWIKQGPVNTPLATTASAGGDGSLSDPKSKVLFGNSDFDYGRFNGMQYDLGGWFGDQHIWGVSASAFLLEQRAVGAGFSSDAGGDPLLARPFTNVTTIVNNLPSGNPSAFLIAYPGAFSGNINIETTTRLWGTEVNLVRNLYATTSCRIDFLAGFRYLDLDEQLTISSQSKELANGALFFESSTALPEGSVVGISDQFRARNQFYAGQGGIQAEYNPGAFTFDVTAALGFGPNHETVAATGLTTATTPDGITRSTPSGLFALSGTNSFRTTTNWFAISPEVNLRAGYHFTESIFAFVGYNFLYLSNAVRPGSEVNANVNPLFVPSSGVFNPANQKQAALFQPTLPSIRDDFWAQGIQFGVEFRY